MFCISCGARLLAAEAGGPAGAAVGQAAPTAEAGAVATPLSVTSLPGGAGRRRRWLVMLVALLVNLLLLAGSAWLVYAALVRYAERGQPSLSLGAPRLVRVAPRRGPDAAPAAPVATPAPAKASASPAGPSATSHKAQPARQPPAASARVSRPPAPARPPSTSPETPAGAAGPEVSEADRVRAGLDADSVRMVVQHYLPQVQLCHGRALKQQESLAGVVEIQFEIGGDGRVSSSSVRRNTTGHEGLGKCIAATLRNWRFPRPVGGEAIFIYPFYFSAGSQ